MKVDVCQMQVPSETMINIDMKGTCKKNLPREQTRAADMPKCSSCDVITKGEENGYTSSMTPPDQGPCNGYTR